MKYLTLICIPLLTFHVNAQLSLDLESGVSINTKNSIRYPNLNTSISDKVDIPEEFGNPYTFFYRLRASYTINERHTVSALFAPLSFSSSGTFNRPVNFGEYTYESDDFVDVIYKFNSYRLTYRYQLVRREKIRFGIGLTGKIRDARIAFESYQKNDETTDLGFVPLVNFKLAVWPKNKLSVIIQGDALVGAQGRAEDIFGGFTYQLSEQLQCKGGYRVLEGGANIDQVFNFSFIHYAAAGAIITL